MKKPIFQGVCTALVTPFLDGKVNYPMLKMLLKNQLDAGIKAVVLCGTTGEAATLSDTEKYEIFHQSKEYVSEECTIIAGTGSNSTAHAIHLSKLAEEAGADALLIVSPYYNKATPDGLIAHYLSIANSVSIPIILYNVPTRTGVDIPVSVYSRLCRVPNIVGVKESTTDISKISRIKNACTPDFTIWSGNDDLTIPMMSIGAQGVISVASNIVPEKIIAMTQAAQNEDYERAGNMQNALQPLVELLFSQVNPIPVKAALSILGFDCGGCRLPLTSLDADNYKKLKEYFS